MHEQPTGQEPTKFPGLIRPDFYVLREVLREARDRRACLVWKPRQKDEGIGFDKIPCDPLDGAFRKPNTASARAIMTLDEAQEAVERLQGEGHEAGLGAMPSRLGFPGGDFDGVIQMNGQMRIAGWAERAAAGTYWERSPGGSGMRVLYRSVPSFLMPMFNGVERGKVGIYWQESNRYLTLTGAGNIAPITDMSEEVAEMLLKRWTEAGARPWTPDSRSDGYPSGAEGMALAAEDIISGAALHPALSAWLVRAVRVMPIDLAEERAWELFHHSAAQHREPDRWNGRMTSIPGLLAWIRKRKGFRPESISPQRLQGVRQKLESYTLRLVTVDGAAVDQTDEEAGFAAYVKEFCEAEGLTEAEVLGDEIMADVLRADFHKQEGIDSEVRRRIEREEAEIEAERARIDTLAYELPEIPEDQIPTRPWFYRNFALRGYLSLLIGPPGVSKTTFLIGMALHAAAGKSYGDLELVADEEPRNVLLVLAEEDKDEINLRVAAVRKTFGIKFEDTRGKLFVMSMSEARVFRIGSMKGREYVENVAGLADIEALIRMKEIGLVLSDPLGKLHGVEENSNDLMKIVMQRLTMLAQATRTAIVIAHHTPKGVEVAGNLMAARGGSSVGGEVKIAVTLSSMDAKMAEDLNVPEDEMHRYARRDDAKGNNHERRPAPVWYKRQNVALSNSENVGVLIQHTFEDDAHKLTPVIVGAFLTLVRKSMTGPLEARIQVGKNHTIAAEALRAFLKERDITLSLKKARAKITGWLERGLLITEMVPVPPDGKRSLTFLARGEAAAPEVVDED
ncbi:MAG TPA: AAA family ATPase [Paracoccus sp. (in: a-proteobacteria)]|uniref:AAA family ATPase n=1 Tax=Paracoccus sp. TaxID=267 RepID=UPI002B64D1BF|nr:AAA family ATPase [Paracoccus sp. (in: a-proteobacteria)]HWL56957.1 AAA family ATPase [Paracoccus sp. (in: a-proteobacteria)]